MRMNVVAVEHDLTFWHQVQLCNNPSYEGEMFLVQGRKMILYYASFGHLPVYVRSILFRTVHFY